MACCKCAIVTGATGGIGHEISSALASEGSTVIMACRNEEKVRQTVKEMKHHGINGNFEFIRLDLASLDSVKKFVEEIDKRKLYPDVLINNSGIMCKHFTTTENGFETTLAVNYLAPAALSLMMLPIMSSYSVPRIVNTVSCTTMIARPYDIWNMSDENFSRMRSYSASKLALYLFTATLASKTKDKAIVCAADPGVVNTGIINMQMWYDSLADILFRPLIKSPAKGAKAALNGVHSNQSGMICKSNKVKPIPSALSELPLCNELWEQTINTLSKYGFKTDID